MAINLDQLVQYQNLLKDEQQTPEICLDAVQYNGCLLYLIKEQTPEICLAAVKQNPASFSSVKIQTLEICLAAVSNFYYRLRNLRYVIEQTPEICLAAVKNRESLSDVKEQTHELCVEAVRANYHNIQYIRNPTVDMCFELLVQYRGYIRSRYSVLERWEDSSKEIDECENLVEETKEYVTQLCLESETLITIPEDLIRYEILEYIF